MRVIFAFIMFLATISFVLLSLSHPTTLLLTLAIVVLWGSYGMGTVVVYTSSMQHVRAGREGTDFTVQTVITHLMGILISIICGIIANSIGYTGMFALQGAIALASFFYTIYMNEQSKDNERNTIQEI